MNEIEKGQLASLTVQCLSEGAGAISRFPKMLKKVIEERVWEHRIYHGREYRLPNLRALITEKPMAGWGEDPKKIEALIKDDPEVLPMFREAMKEQGERNDLHDNVMEVATQGNSKAYTLTRLQKDNPEIYEEVKAGKLTANAGAIKAGWRKTPTPMEIIQRLLPKLKARQHQQLHDLLETDFGCHAITKHHPIRIQRSRAKGWTLPENAVSVCRPGKWGNPFKIEEQTPGKDATWAVAEFRRKYENDADYQAAAVRELKGKDLCCYCGPEGPCHADVLLEWANGSTSNEGRAS
jgi:hypothetical protein